MLEINKIYNMDCLEGMKYIDDKSIDMILCDLPYGTTACKWDTVIPFEPLWEQYERIIKDNGAIVLFGSQPFTSQLINSNLKLFKYCLVWEKERPSNPALAKNQFMKWHEDICIFGKNKTKFNPQMEIRKEKNKRNNKLGITHNSDVYGNFKLQQGNGMADFKYPSSVLKFNVQRGLHPTQKPVALFEYLIKTYTQPGEIVLDNCIGSGTTAIACINTNRNYIGFELNKEYYEIAKNRINKHIIDNNLQDRYNLIT